MKVVILAGGLGTRLRSVVNDVPKPLAPINGTPFLALMLEALHRQGIDEIILSIGYMAETFDSFLNEIRASFPRLTVETLVEPERLGTGGALRFCQQHYTDDCYLVLNGDSYCQFDLKALHAAAAEQGSAMVVAHVDNISRYGEVSLNDDSTVAAFHEKRPCDDPGWINAGIYLLPGELVTAMPANTAFSLEERIIPQALHKGLVAIRACGPFIDIGIPEDYQALCRATDHYFSVISPQPMERS